MGCRSEGRRRNEGAPEKRGGRWSGCGVWWSPVWGCGGNLNSGKWRVWLT
ncbi:hypothetical protein HanPSC8_Chr02g0048421 [Helianthus annuus]|nr:hypothetical protein HanPSC8_Chr02g0048421 [Helianthus annuus]